jgi:hypothetical protein
MRIREVSSYKGGMLLLSCMVVLLLLAAAPMWAQSTVATGSIQGTVTDPSDAVVSNANVTITNKATGQTIKVKSSSAGTYQSGALTPGDYEVKIEAPGFQTTVTAIPVQVGVIASGSTRLTVGKTSEVVEVTSSAVQVNTEQATVQGVLTAQQIENLPINGRNFLDLAQLEPGVQIQDGSNFDPTKNGFSSISFGGRFGRTARIEVDGIDISDETVGTTTQNIPAGSISEFQVSQSSLDLSTELTSSGAVNVVTKSGTNKWHGDAFYLFRDHRAAANIGDHDIPFQRNQFGGSIGGPIIKGKLFFFADAERVKQDALDQVATGGAFLAIKSGFSSPFRDTNGIARLDWQIKPDNYKAFYRFSYEQNRAVRAFVPQAFQPFANVDYTPVHAAGFDFTTGSFTHAIRFGYTKFRNGITDAVDAVHAFNPAPGIELAIGPDFTCTVASLDSFCSGPNLLAPQQTYQSNHQIKYDGSKLLGSHILRYGFGYNHIQGGGFAKFLALGPAVQSSAGVDPNPLNYPVQTVIMGNGQGFSSEKPAFGLPAGGLGPDNRIQWYVGDSWKIKPNLTLSYGVRYVHDTGRTDSDLGSLPCSKLDPTLAANLAAGGTPCTTNILDLFGPGLSKPVHNPALNFGPQFGFVWSPTSSRKTVIRSGIGLYYENAIFNNNLFDRPGRLQQGLFLAFQPACSGGNPVSFTLPGTSTVVTPAFCGQPIGSVFNQIIALQKQYQAATAASGAAKNPNFFGNSLSASTANGITPFASDYKTPRSVQMNIGVQHEFTKGVVLTVDYLRNVSTHTNLAIDVNHVGDARFLNKGNALAAISATNAAFGCGNATTAAAINCAIAAGAKISDYAGNGLDSGTNVCGGGPCPTAAFAGKNDNLGVFQALFPAGRSVYNALQTSLKANIGHPVRGVKNFSWQVSYSLSSYISTANDSDFINQAQDNNNPTGFIGPNALDRRHQLSFGGTFDLPWSFRFSAISHVYSPLPLNLRLPTSGSAGGIFVSDVTGDGSGDGSGIYNLGDLVPGTKLGAFGRGTSPGDLNNLINAYNSTQAGQATPAGQALIQSGLFTLAQLQALGAVQQQLALAPNGQAGLDWLKVMDFKFSWPKKIRENLTIEPSFSAFNVFNFANFDSPGSTLSSVLDGSIGSANGTTVANRNSKTTNRIGIGSGTFGFGAPRVLEFGLRLSF